MNKRKKITISGENVKIDAHETNTHSFAVYNEFSSCGIASAIKDLVGKKEKPIIVCIGSDLVLGDSLGPLVGTMLLNKKVPLYVYGTLSYPITAKEIGVAKSYLSSAHPKTPIIAIDAAVGNQDDVGLIRVKNKGLFPGLGVAKKLGEIGDASIMGVVAERSIQNYNLFNLTRLGMIYKMAEQIANGIEQYVLQCFDNKENKSNAGNTNTFAPLPIRNNFNNLFADAN